MLILLQKLPSTHRTQRRHGILSSEYFEFDGEVREDGEYDGRDNLSALPLDGSESG